MPKRKVKDDTAKAEEEDEAKKPCKQPAALALTVTLSNGKVMPRVGFGTYKLKESEAGAAVRSAVKAGYKLVDTAHVYCGGKMEPVVGRAVSEDVFVVTKQWRGFHGYDETMKCVKQSLKRLGVDKVDLLLMHWPGPAYSAMGRSKARIEAEGIQCYFKKGHEDVAALRLETWRAMEDCVEQGLCDSIGVSNFAPSHIRKLLAWPQLRVRPVVNQVELHPYLQQRELVDLCKEEKIVMQAYGSLGGQDTSANNWAELGLPPLMEHPAVLAASVAHKASAAAVLLRWALHHDFAIIPKSRDPKRLQDNASCADFDLSKEELAAVDALDLGGMKGRLCWRRDELRDLQFD